MNTTSIIARRSTPVYTIENITEYPLNPYREFVYHCANTVFPNLQGKTNMSLKDFNNLSPDKQKDVLATAIAGIPGTKIEFAEKSSHKRIFLEAAIFHKEICIAELQMFTHLTYISKDDSNKELDHEYVAAELNFKRFDGFDFMNLSRGDNVLDFSKDDTDTETLDMMFAHILGLTTFTEFIKAYKAKSLIIKNIELFSNKLIKPYVSDLQNAYSPEHFLIGVICGENIHKMTYPYENYLNSIKEFADAIKKKYGDKFYVDPKKEDEKN